MAVFKGMAITRGTEIGQRRETLLDCIWHTVCLAFNFFSMEAKVKGISQFHCLLEYSCSDIYKHYL